MFNSTYALIVSLAVSVSLFLYIITRTAPKRKDKTYFQFVLENFKNIFKGD